MIANTQEDGTHLTKRTLSNHLDRPEIPQADLRPAQPQKLTLRARMSPNFTCPTVLLYARQRSLELRTSTTATLSKPQRARDDTHAPNIQVDRSLERKTVMRLQFYLSGCSPRAGVRREVVRTPFVIDVICGLLLRWWWWWWWWVQDQVRQWGRCGGMMRGGRGTGERGAVDHFTVVVHGGGRERWSFEGCLGGSLKEITDFFFWERTCYRQNRHAVAATHRHGCSTFVYFYINYR